MKCHRDARRRLFTSALPSAALFSYYDLCEFQLRFHTKAKRCDEIE